MLHFTDKGARNIFRSPCTTYISIYYVTIIVGHYLDHCRFDISPPDGFPSRMINSSNITKLLDLFKISNRKRKELIKEVIKTLVVTLYDNYDGNNINNIDNIEIFDTDMTKICWKLNGKKIYRNCTATDPNFLNRARNFNVAWTDIGLSDVINGLLETAAESEYK